MEYFAIIQFPSALTPIWHNPSSDSDKVLAGFKLTLSSTIVTIVIDSIKHESAGAPAAVERRPAGTYIATSCPEVSAKLVRVPLQLVPQEPPETAAVPEVSLNFHSATNPAELLAVSPSPVGNPDAVKSRVSRMVPS
jgi:hypothetical protein